jgi:prepilin-type N-terminal cleavage/methylation domain-containing protein
MNTIKSDGWRVPGGVMGAAAAGRSRHTSRFTFHSLAFTLIELLVVISIIGILAALLFPVLGSVKRQQYLRNATAEMEQLETAIERYKAAEGFYPPDNHLNPGNPLINQLYFELLGTTNTDSTPTFQSLDDPTIQLPQSALNNLFGVSGFMNCSKPGSAEDAHVAQNFLPGLKPNQISPSYTNSTDTHPFKILVTSVGGPDLSYHPLGAGAVGINPWRYNSSNPTNNPGAYDLWIQLSIGGKTNLVCNWNKQAQLNSPLP